MGTILFDLSTCANNDDGMRQKYVKNYSYIDFINIIIPKVPLNVSRPGCADQRKTWYDLHQYIF